MSCLVYGLVFKGSDDCDQLKVLQMVGIFGCWLVIGWMSDELACEDCDQSKVLQMVGIFVCWLVIGWMSDELACKWFSYACVVL
jgi:sugar phosphate permease